MTSRWTAARRVTGLIPLIVSLASGAALATVTLTPAARDSTPSPDGNGRFSTYTEYGEPCINDAGQVAFVARLAATALGAADNDVLARVSAGASGAVSCLDVSAFPNGSVRSAIATWFGALCLARGPPLGAGAW